MVNHKAGISILNYLRFYFDKKMRPVEITQASKQKQNQMEGSTFLPLAIFILVARCAKSCISTAAKRLLIPEFRLEAVHTVYEIMTRVLSSADAALSDMMSHVSSKCRPALCSGPWTAGSCQLIDSQLPIVVLLQTQPWALEHVNELTYCNTSQRVEKACREWGAVGSFV